VVGTGILKPGDKVLDFTLVEAGTGLLLGPADFAGKQNVVLLFYRGMW
jgi:peroxiredoxin